MPTLAAHWRARLAQVPPLHGLLWMLAMAVLVLQARAQLPFMADDAFISLRYARRLLDGHGLTWTEGPAVEGYSNLLWVLGCALLGWLGVDLVVAARTLGLVATLATLTVLAWSTRRQGWLACVGSLAAVALSGPVVVWAMGGLEQPLLGLWLALGLLTTLSLLPGDQDGEPAPGPTPRPVLAGVFFGLAALTRPDGLLFGIAVVAVVLSANRRLALRLAAPLVGMVLAQLLFRLLYYGDYVPNTGRAKLALGSPHVVRGWYHVWDGLVAQRGTFLLAAAGTGVAWRYGSRRRVLLIGGPLVAWLGYLALIGGDILPAWRHFVPVVVLSAFLIGEGAASARRLGPKVQWAAVILVVNAFFLGFFDRKQDAPLAVARTERWEWDGEVIGRFLARAFGDRTPLLAVDPAGCVPYFSGLPSLDMLGLNDAYLAHHPPASFGQTTSIGHELGDGSYVLSQKPDLVLFCLPGGGAKPCFRSGRDMVQLDEFGRHYQLVGFEGEQPHRFRSQIWVRRDSQKIGIQTSADQVTIPGFLVGDAESTSRLDRAGRLTMAIPPQARLALPGLRELGLSAGRWTVTIDADTGAGTGQSLQVWVDGDRVEPTTALNLTSSEELEISNPGSAAVHLRSVGFVRQGDPAANREVLR
jgi:hypothetical protein